jgi:serine-type D-Ala-D-Ala carboxypeptidase/endopeptidase
MRVLISLAALCLTFFTAFADDGLEARVTALAKPVVDAGEVTGLVVGVVDPKGATRVFGFGRTSLAGKRAPDGKTLFEIGSVSKVFTSLLFADFVERKLVSLDDPVKKYLPESVNVPAHDGREITLAHLASHTSGLPRMPSNFKPQDPANPYVDYTPELLYAFLSSYTLTRDPGAVYDYSNLGAGLLGHLLTLVGKQSYEELLTARITGPLGMKSTRVALGPDDRARFAEGHDADGLAVAPWDQTTLVGAGGIRSTAEDMLIFLRANLGQVKSPLAAALALMLVPRHDTEGGPPGAIGLGWCVRDVGRTVWHNGQTAGFHSWVGFDPLKQWGVVVLANTASGAPDAIGYGLLRRLAGEPVAPMPAPNPVAPTVALSTAQLDALTGVYELSPTFAITVTRAGDHLMGQATGQPAFRLFPSSPTHFALHAVKAEIDFVRAPSGAVTELILHQNGDKHAPRKK